MAGLKAVFGRAEAKLKDLLGDKHICDYMAQMYPGDKEKLQLAEQVKKLVPLTHTKEPGLQFRIVSLMNISLCKHVHYAPQHVARTFPHRQLMT